MRWLIGLFCVAAPLAAQELNDARVQISYKELKTLLEASAARPAPPIDHAVLAARYVLRVESGVLAGVGEFDVQTFRDGPHVVPLASEELVLEAVEPRDAMLVVREGYYALALEGRQRAKVTLKFSLTAPAGKTVEWKVNPAVTTVVEASAQSGPVRVEDGLPAGEGKWRLGRSRAVKLALFQPPPPAPVQPPPVALPAVIRDATGTMRVVADGAFFNKMVWQIRHEGPLVWRVALSDSHQLVAAKVGGRPASPSRPDAKTLEFRLPEPVGEGTAVELSYTGRVKAFDAVRGDLELSLPATPLLIESLRWEVSFPKAYEIAAAQGNVEFASGGSPGEVQLRKELCQGDSPNVRLFYQKPEKP